jgi:hypothetical protein
MCKLQEAKCALGTIHGSPTCWDSIHKAWFGVIIEELKRQGVDAHIIDTHMSPLLAISRDSMCSAFPNLKEISEEEPYTHTLKLIEEFSDKQVVWVGKDGLYSGDDYLYLDFVSEKDNIDACFKQERDADQIISLTRDKENICPDTEKSTAMKDLITGILEECLSVSDEWGGSKLAEWKYGYNVLVDGIEDAVQKIIEEVFAPVHKSDTISNVCQSLLKAVQDINDTITEIKKDTEMFKAVSGNSNLSRWNFKNVKGNENETKDTPA